VTAAFPATSFVCGNAVVYSGKSYATVLIGSQCWFKENLNVGTTIIPPGTMPTNNGIIEKWCNGSDSAIHTTSGDCAVYGGLYSWNEAMGYVTTPGAQGICPAGWHIPTDAEQYTLENYLKDSGQPCDPNRNESDTGASSCATAASKLSLFTSGGNNSSGWTGLLAGFRMYDSYFYYRNYFGYWWSSTQSGGSAWNRLMWTTSSGVARCVFDKVNGFSVRCIKN